MLRLFLVGLRSCCANDCGFVFVFDFVGLHSCIIFSRVLCCELRVSVCYLGLVHGLSSRFFGQPVGKLPFYPGIYPGFEFLSTLGRIYAEEG